jgi:glycosyltransferase involved in cell wall biosynthesis
MIAFLINEINIRGGTHKQFLKLLEYTEKQQIPFTVITRNLDFDRTYPGFLHFKDKIKIINKQKKGGRLWRLLKNMYLLRKSVKDASIVNIHDYGFESCLPAFFCKKVIWQINDLPGCFRLGVHTGKVTFKNKLHQLSIIIYQKLFVNEITVNVSKNADRIYQVFKTKSHVFYCGIEQLNINRTFYTAFDRFRNNTINILTSGVLHPYRNYETQLEVIKELRNRNIDVHLNIIGSTELNNGYYLKIKHLIEIKHLENYVTICGQVDESTFQELHKNSDIFLFINIEQSWGLAVFEAMSCGLPVIVSNSVGATEILTDGVNAIFAEPLDYKQIANQIISLMNDTHGYEKMATVSQLFCNEYTWEKSYCSKMLNLMLSYEKI